MLLLISIIVLLLIVTGLLTTAEVSVMAMQLPEDEEARAISKRDSDLIEKLQSKADEVYAAVEIVQTFCITLSAVLLVIVNGHLFSDSWFNEPLHYTLETAGAVVLISIVYWLFGVLLPKAVAERRAQKLAPSFVHLLDLLLNLLRFPAALIVGFANLLLKPFKLKTSLSAIRMSEDRILAVLDEGLKTGAISETEHEILENVFEFNDLKAKEVMVPRTEMTAVELTDDSQEVLRAILKTGHSLIPMYQESLDNITGIIHIKDVLRSVIEKKSVDFKTLIRPAYFVPETKLISEILKDMQKRGERIAVITDEYGGTEGVITLEDILSEIVGDFSEAGKEETKEFYTLPDGNYCVLGSMYIEDFNELFGLEFPLSERYNTIAGFVSFQTGKILNTGETMVYEGIVFELVKKIKQKMVQFKISGEEKPLTVNSEQ